MSTERDEINQAIDQVFVPKLKEQSSQQAYLVEINLNNTVDLVAAQLDADEELKAYFKRRLKIASLQSMVSTYQGMIEQLEKIDA